MVQPEGKDGKGKMHETGEEKSLHQVELASQKPLSTGYKKDVLDYTKTMLVETVRS